MLAALACLAGAAVETALSGGYNVCQFFNLEWGKNCHPSLHLCSRVLGLAMFILAMVDCINRSTPIAIGEHIHCLRDGGDALYLLPDSADCI